MPRLGRGLAPRGARYVPAPPLTRNADALTVWTAALTNRGSAPARWLAIGGGLTEGQGASTRANRWLDAVLSTIRTAKSVTGGPGFVSAAYQVTGPDSPWAASWATRTGAATVGTTAGVGGRYVTLAPAGGTGGQFGTSAFGTATFGGSSGAGSTGTVTFTVTGNTADLWYISEPTSGTLSYAIDGGAATTVATAGTRALRRIQGIALGPNAAHSVVVTAAAGTVYVSGLTVYAGDAGAGIHLYEASRVGATSAAGASSVGDLSVFAGFIAPDLVTIELPPDDANAGVVPAGSIANIAALVDMLRGLPKVPSIVLVLPYHAVAAPSGTASVLPRAAWTVTADSEETSSELAPATNAIDGSASTMWHTKYSGTAAALPHTFTIDMRATTTVSALRYTPRSGGGNGTIGQYQIHTSMDGGTWGTAVAAGVWADDATEKVASFPAVTARYVRLTALSEAGNRGQWSSASEVNLEGGGAVGGVVSGWPDYVAALRRMATVDPSLGLVDLSIALPAADAAGGTLYRIGGRYPTDAGHTAIASTVSGFLNVDTPAVPPPSSGSAGALLLLTNVA